MGDDRIGVLDMKQVNLNIIFQIMVYIYRKTDSENLSNYLGPGLSKRQIRSVYNGKKLDEILEMLIQKKFILLEMQDQPGKEQKMHLFRLTPQGQDEVERLIPLLSRLLGDI